jgi:hypothetical protein
MAKTKTKAAGKIQDLTEDQLRGAIAEAAYFRWLNRGGGNGMDQEDWLSAEQSRIMFLTGSRTTNRPF